MATEPQTERIYIGNIISGVTEADLIKLLGLGKTDYLKNSSSVELIKAKGIAFVTVPAESSKYILELDQIEYYGRKLNVKPAHEKREKEKRERGSNEQQGNRRRFNNGRGGPNQRWTPSAKVKYQELELQPDQVIQTIDCGVNFTNPKYSGYTDYVIARAQAAGVQKMIVTGLKFNGCKLVMTMAKTRPNRLFAATGIHPHFLSDDWKEKTASQLEDMIKEPYCVAVGECGLDFNRNYSPQDTQKSAFEAHIELAIKYQKPLLVHDRDAHETIIEILEKYEGKNLPKVVIHCFTGTADNIKAYLAKGYYIGVTGFVCKDEHGAGLREAIASGVLPLDRIVLQTNSPYMMPNGKDLDAVSSKLLQHCYDGTNEPCTISIIVRCIARQLKQEPNAVAQVLFKTAVDVFKFPNISAHDH